MQSAGNSVAEKDTTPASILQAGRSSLGRFAWFTLAYNIAVVLWGAYVRATGSGAGCGNHWPLCNGEFLPAAPQIQTVIEFTHRVTSALSLVLVAILLVWCWRHAAKTDWPRYSAIAAAVLVLNEAVLGALLVLLDHVGGLSQSATHALFLCLHFGNTLLLLAALALTVRWLSSGNQRLSFVARPHETVATGLGLVSVIFIGISGSMASFGDTLFPADSLRNAIVQDFSSSGHILLRLRLLHPAAAVIGSIYILWLLLLTVTLGAQIALGIANVILLAPVWLQLTHLFVAEMFWIQLVLASADQLFVKQLLVNQLFANRRLPTASQVSRFPGERAPALIGTSASTVRHSSGPAEGTLYESTTSDC